MFLRPLATLLGHVDGMSGQEIVIEDLHKKPAMIEALKGKKIDEVEEYDIYDIPGDRRYTNFIFDSRPGQQNWWC